MLKFFKNKIDAASSSSDKPVAKKKEQIILMTRSEYLEPIKDEYVKRLSQLPLEEVVDDGYNPGPSNPDGSVNFECHCVSHLVASPCGYAFRKALTCQKSATEAELDKGACTEEFYEFIKCAMRTQCFRMKGDGEPLTSDSRDEDNRN